MAHGGLQALGLALAGAGWLALLAATALPQWEVSTFAGDSIITALVTMKGLWMSCVSTSTGQLQCKSYDSVLALPAHLQATRALMVVSVVLGPLALAAAVAGMRCTRCGGDDPPQERLGLLALVASSWYGHRIVTSFYDPTIPINLKYEFGSALCEFGTALFVAGVLYEFGTALFVAWAGLDFGYEFGTALFVAWAGAALALLGGVPLGLVVLRPRGGRGGQGGAGLPPGQDPPPRAPPGAREYV
ncbi:claudin-7-like [Ammospiza maritima maritima]